MFIMLTKRIKKHSNKNGIFMVLNWYYFYFNLILLSTPLFF